MFCIC